jgi:hypothetical protein
MTRTVVFGAQERGKQWQKRCPLLQPEQKSGSSITMFSCVQKAHVSRPNPGLVSVALRRGSDSSVRKTWG